MAKKKLKVAKPAKAPKEPRKTVVGTWTELFKANPKEKLTDVQIAKAMSSEFPGKTAYEPSDVRVHRGLYNKGKLAHQTATPESPVHEYDKDGTALPLWGEKSAAKAAASRKARVKRAKAS